MEIENWKKHIEDQKRFITLDFELANVRNFTINDDLTIDVHGDVRDIRRLVANEHLLYQFGRVEGDFDVHGLGLVTLERSPHYVGGNFNCSDNNIRAFTCGPKKVMGNFISTDNEGIRYLAGCPDYVGGDFICSNNCLTNLEGAPSYVGGNMIFDNTDLLSLDGFKHMEGSLFISCCFDMTNDTLAYYALTHNIKVAVCDDFEDFQKVCAYKKLRAKLGTKTTVGSRGKI